MKSAFPMVVASENPVLVKHGLRNESSASLQVVHEMEVDEVHELVRDMVSEDVEVSDDDEMRLRLATGFLVQKDRKHAYANIGTVGLTPFSEGDWFEALQYADKNIEAHEAVFNLTEETEETVTDSGEVKETVVRRGKKRGRKGGTYVKVSQFMNLHRSSGKSPKELSEIASEKLGIPQTTALQYIYKYLKKHQIEGVKGTRGRKAKVWPMVQEFMDENPNITAKDAAERMESELSIAKGTAMAYAYRWIKENRTEG